jgi:hypothetical protein
MHGRESQPPARGRAPAARRTWGETAEPPARTRLHPPAPKISRNIRAQGLIVGKLNTTNDVQPSGEYL